jgi:hypothetical protein
MARARLLLRIPHEPLCLLSLPRRRDNTTAPPPHHHPSSTTARNHSDMAATMSYEPALSASLSRTHLSDAPSMADQLPSVNFNFEDLRDRMARFTSRFDDFIEKGRKRVLEERNQFRMNVAELQGMPCSHWCGIAHPLTIKQQRIKSKRRAQSKSRR